ncbi:MAG TPA: hypothetical protein VGQ83_18835 [Polyangia bacterium]|jgi:hypothetical protein
MARRGWVLLLAAAAACAPAPRGGEDIGVARAAVGEPQNGFPSWDERVIHLWINRGRADPQADLTENCSAGAVPEQHCYTPQPPLLWSYELNRSARFHSANQTSCGVMTHTSPCTLVADIGTQYTPGPCNGDKACACQGGTCGCQGGGCTDTWARIGDFGGGGNGECVAGGGPGNPLGEYYMWICESFNQDVCQYVQGPPGGPTNGHRWNILMGAGPAVGAGCAGSYCTLDFGGPAAPASKIVVGAHYPATGSVALRAHWSDTAPPQQALVNIDGTCQPMTKERGVDGGNATYLLDNQAGSGCRRYFFVFKDAGGALVTYPETGSFGVGCATDWDATRPATGAGCNCTPACSGKQCGPDGCGGSCAPGCAANQSCQGGTCACTAVTCGATCCAAAEVCAAGACCAKSCGGKQCGPDGCGGACGTCQGSLSCDASGACGCPLGLTACGTTCVNTASDVANCGACDHPCTAPEVCAAGICAATCPTGTEDCGGSCADLASDATHCGRCDLACAPGATCADGRCPVATVDGGSPDGSAAPGERGALIGSCAFGGAAGPGGALAALALLALFARRRRR